MLNYQDYTKRNPITKTIRFRLFPCEETGRYLSERKAMERDLLEQQELERMKEVIDRGIRDIAEKTLSSIAFDFEELAAAKGRSEREYERTAGKLRKSLEQALSEAMPGEVKPKRIDSKLFLEECLRKYSRKSENCRQFEDGKGKSDDMSEAKYTILLHQWI